MGQGETNVSSKKKRSADIGGADKSLVLISKTFTSRFVFKNEAGGKHVQKSDL